MRRQEEINVADISVHRRCALEVISLFRLSSVFVLWTNIVCAVINAHNKYVIVFVSVHLVCNSTVAGLRWLSRLWGMTLDQLSRHVCVA